MPGTDVHCHLDDPAFDADRDEALARARAAGVDRVIVPAADPADWGRVLRLCRERPACVPMLGVHPWYAADLPDLDDRLHALATSDIVGIGEIGLDHHREPDPRRRLRQREVFRAQVALAVTRGVPIAIHAVHAVPGVLEVIDEVGLPAAGGFVHLWTSSAELAKEAVKRGLHLSFGPIVIGGRAKKAIASAAEIPLDRLLLETDAPGRATRGEPADLRAIAREVARIRGAPFDVVWQAAAENADRLLPRGASGPQRAC